MGMTMNLEHIRAEIERMRHQISRQRKDVQSLHRAGISTLPAEALARMQATVDNLCAERDKRVGEQRIKYLGTKKLSKVRKCGSDRARGLLRMYIGAVARDANRYAINFLYNQ
jgi:hypothetical protein